MTVPAEAALGEALDRLLPSAARLGVTRLADITGLDRVGLPVAIAVRPLGRLLSVNQGKGTSLAAAKLGALMEAAEQAAAERHALPLFWGSAEELGRSHALADPGLLPRRRDSPFRPDLPILWTAARELRSGAERLVPYELVHCDFSFPQPAGSGCFPLTTSGLGAGLTRRQALEHALLEAVERDAMSLFELGGWAQAERCIDLRSARHPETLALIQACGAAGLLLVAFDATSDLGLPTVSCRVMERDPEAAAMAHAAEGSAARPDPEAALLAAIMEALQSRLTFIAGTRDDLHPLDYLAGDRAAELLELQRLAAGSITGRSLASLDPGWAATEDPLERVAAGLSRIGCGEPLVVDFAPPLPEVSVLRVIVPGLEPPLHPAHAPGARACRARAAA